MKNVLKLATAALMLVAAPAAAEMEYSLYFGTQSVDKSRVTGNLPGNGPGNGGPGNEGPGNQLTVGALASQIRGGPAINRQFDWEGKPFAPPLYYGGRAMWWTPANLGFGIEGTHTKALASNADLAATGTSRFEFSDGHNIITANIMKRWPGAFASQRLTPYIGAGAGVAIPHVDIRVNGASNRTFGFEVTGPALRGIAGVKYDINDKWAVFSEYQITWSDNDVTIDADPGGTPGKINTVLVTHALNVGISFSF